MLYLFLCLDALCHHRIDDFQGTVGNSQVLFCLLADPLLQRRNDAEIDVHGLEVFHTLIADVQTQRTDGSGFGEVRQFPALALTPSRDSFSQRQTST